jgi:hypothetical protein
LISLASVALATVLVLISGCGSQGNAEDDDADPDAQAPLPDGSTDPADASGLGDGSAPTPDGAYTDPDAASPDGGGGSDAGIPGNWIVPPAAACAPAGDPCALGAASGGIHASYRKDAYLPRSDYDEYPDDPVDGGRFHIAAISAVSGTVTALRINGTLADDLLVEPLMEWYHVWPRQVIAGEPVWIAFHSRDPAWDSAATGQVTVETDAGLAVDGTFPVQATPAPLTYVTTTADRQSFVIHVRNTDSVAHPVTGLLLNGRDVLAADVACVPQLQIPAGRSVMWTVPRCAAVSPGEAWTVVVQYANAPAAVGVGRVLPARFPVEAWTNTSECPFPSGDAANHQSISGAGIDTIYFHGGVCNPNKCDCDAFQILNQEIPQTPDLYAVATWGLTALNLTDTSGIMAWSTGDESDGQVYENGVPVAAGKAAKSLQAWLQYPEVPTFNGGKTNRNIGSFAGMADIQGMDFYTAACAPHITAWGTHPPLRGPYDYLRNTRDNHMPLPTWLYAQGLSPAWNQDGLLGGTIHVQPDPQEILVQGLQAVAAGAKGLLWFQANQDEAAHDPSRWQAIADASWMVRGVRDHLREGDITGQATTSGDAIVELIRAREALVVPVINLATTDAPTDVACGGSLASESLVPHWVLASQQLDVQLTIPASFGVEEIFEVQPQQTVDVTLPVSVNGRVVTLGGVPLDNTVPVRLYVLAAHGGVRADVQAALTP